MFWRDMFVCQVMLFNLYTHARNDHIKEKCSLFYIFFSRGIIVYDEMSSKPRDPILYAKIKKRVDRQFNTWSAYASGQLVQQYKAAFKKKYGSGASPYIGKKTSKDPLATWFREIWVDVTTGEPCGSVKTNSHYPTCRPKSTRTKMTLTQRRKMHATKQRYGKKTATYPASLY